MNSTTLRNYILFAIFGFIVGVLAERYGHPNDDIEIVNSFNVLVVKPEEEP